MCAHEVALLWESYKRISESVRRDGVIDEDEFRQALGEQARVIADRIFQAFDENKDRVLTFSEFTRGLSSFCEKASYDERLAFSFRLYDIDGDGFVTRKELLILLRDTVLESFVLDLSEQQLDSLVDQTFREADLDGDGRISISDYRALVRRYPRILSNLTLNLKVFLKECPSSC
eukprot:m51a1_g11027 hypothetical protein (175) ;mRNA; r:415029-415826